MGTRAQHLQPPVALFTDRPRPPVVSYLRNTVSKDWKKGTQTFQPLVTGFAALLSRYTAQEEVVFAVCMGESDGACKRLHCSLDGAMTAVALEQSVAVALSNAKEGGEEECHVLLAVNCGFPALAEADVMVQVNADGLTADYDEELFDRETVEGLLGHYEVLLKAISDESTTPLSALPLLSKGEAFEREGESPAVAKSTTLALHEWFRESAAQFHDRVAISFEDEELTYGDVDDLSDEVAEYLAPHIMQPGALIALYTDRSPWMVIGILGILKAGGAYLPVDASYPAERISFMLSDAKCSLVLTESAVAGALPASEAQIVVLDEDVFASEKCSSASARRTALPLKSCRPDTPAVVGTATTGKQAVDTSEKCSSASARRTDDSTSHAAHGVATTSLDDVAYCIYTSGSTGQPKGVLISHANATRLFTSTHPWFAFNEQDVWTLFHSSAFDFSVWEIWGALLYGGRLVIVPYLVSRSPEEFAGLVEEQGVTVLNQTPSSFKRFSSAALKEGCSFKGLRYVIFGGEALDPKVLRPWYDVYPEDAPQLVNMYGITETTVHVTYRPLTKQDAVDARGSLIGQPIPDLKLHVLDSAQQPVPLGVPGELFVEGAGLAQGYLDRPGLTAERFIDSPTGGRTYRTGDLVRRLPDDVEYLGRVDQQVKIRGFRVELGEIESVMRAHDDVVEAAVVLGEDRSGHEALLGYYVQTKEGIEGALRKHLASRLPPYMCPSVLIHVAGIPLTANGKLDRRSLPQPDAHRPEVESPFEAPRTQVEQVIAKVYQEILGVEKVGVHDNFFELGGDSFSVGEVAAKLKEALGVEIDMVKLFQYVTISALADYVQPKENSGTKIDEIDKRAAIRRRAMAQTRARMTR